ncbi:hypothetical protein [Longispora albida]|uniref:hypothetical protein n=1 Tax=Longispora albida TaxID=203523 RepID=UPI0003788202|nr:hypothetical protein [Longispora albida]
MANAPARLADLLGFVGQELDRQAVEAQRLRTIILQRDQRNAALENELRQHGARIAELEKELRQVRGQLKSFDERFTEALAEAFTKKNPDATSERHTDHYPLASEYQGMVNDLLRQAAREAYETPPPRLELANLVGELARALLGSPKIDSGEVLDLCRDVDTTNRLVEEFSALRERISGLGHEHRWDFECAPGGQLHPERQDAWQPCDPAQPVLFLVAPAYVVGNRLLCKQLVATGEE